MPKPWSYPNWQCIFRLVFAHFNCKTCSLSVMLCDTALPLLTLLTTSFLVFLCSAIKIDHTISHPTANLWQLWLSLLPPLQPTTSGSYMLHVLLLICHKRSYSTSWYLKKSVLQKKELPLPFTSPLNLNDQRKEKFSAIPASSAWHLQNLAFFNPFGLLWFSDNLGMVSINHRIFINGRD